MEPENLVCSSFTQLRCRTRAKGRVETDLWSFYLRPPCYSGGGDGDVAGDSCSDVSGVAVGEGLEGSGDVSVGGFSFNEDGTCINESKESLA